MPKRGRIFPGITRQVVISDETHQWLAEVAEEDNKYIGELADELLRSALRHRQQTTPHTNGVAHRPYVPQGAPS